MPIYLHKNQSGTVYIRSLKKPENTFLKNVVTSFMSLTNKQNLEREGEILQISQQKVTCGHNNSRVNALD